VADVQRARHRRRRRVDREDVGPGGAAVEAVGAVLLPGLGPSLFEAIEARALGIRDGADDTAFSRGLGRVHDRVTVPACCASTTLRPPPCARSSSESPGRSRVRVRPTVYGLPPPRPWALHPRLRRPAPLPAVLGPRCHLRLEHHRHRRQHHQACSRRGRSEEEVTEEYEAAWWEAMDALGVLRPTATPHATDYVDDMVSLVGDLMARGVAYETSDGGLPRCRQGARLRTPRRPAPRLAAGGRPGEATTRSVSPLDFVLWKRAKPGEPQWPHPSVRGARAGTPSAWSCPSTCSGTGSTSTGRPGPEVPHHENERAQAVAEGRPFARHWVHTAGCGRRGEDVQVVW